MSEEFNLMKSIDMDGGGNINMRLESATDIASVFYFASNDWQLSPNSNFSHNDQILFSNALYNNLDIVSNDKMFDKLKNYEQKFRLSSEDFYKKWMNGEMASSPEFYDWVAIFKGLYV